MENHFYDKTICLLHRALARVHLYGVLLPWHVLILPFNTGLTRDSSVLRLKIFRFELLSG